MGLLVYHNAVFPSLSLSEVVFVGVKSLSCTNHSLLNLKTAKQSTLFVETNYV